MTGADQDVASGSTTEEISLQAPADEIDITDRRLAAAGLGESAAEDADPLAPVPGGTGERDTAGAEEPLAARLEALLVVLEGPLDPAVAAEATGSTTDEVQAALGALAADYESAQRGFRLRETGSGWTLFAAPEHRETVRRAVVGQVPARLSPAALETLAVVAYRQPVTRAQVAAIRGVAVDAVMRTLVGRGLVEEHSTDPSTGAVRYATSAEFLDRLGVRSLADLPPLANYLPDIDAIDPDSDQPST